MHRLIVVGLPERVVELLQQRDQAVATAKADAATVEADKAAANIAAENLGYTRILSPIDGKTGPILLQPGNLVSVNGLTAPLVTINGDLGNWIEQGIQWVD